MKETERKEMHLAAVDDFIGQICSESASSHSADWEIVNLFKEVLHVFDPLKKKHQPFFKDKVLAWSA